MPLVGWSLLATMLLLASEGAVGHGTMRQFTKVTSPPASQSVVSTFVLVDGGLGLLILWRGQPGWFLSSLPGVSGSGGGQPGIVNVSLEYGTIKLDLSFDTIHHAVRLNGKALSLTSEANVLLVDDVDSPQGPRLASSLAVAPGDANIDPTEGSVVALFKKMPEAMAFLRCEVRLSDDEIATRMRGTPPAVAPVMNRMTAGVCRELEGR